jgi:MFS family permease
MWSIYAPLLRNRKFALLTAGQMTSQVGNFVGYVAVMAILYQLTGSSLLVGTYMGAQALAGLLVGPAAGAVVDRWDRRSIMIFSDLIRAVLVLALVFAHAAWQVLLVAMVKSVAASFFNPAKTALTPRIVGKEHLPAALSLEQTLQGTVQILGPVLGGLAVGIVGIRGAFAVDAATFLISCLSLLLFRVEPEAAGVDGSQPGRSGQSLQGRAGWLSGYRQVLADGLFARLALMRGLSLVGVWAMNVVLVAYAYETLGVGHFGYGILTSALGAGAILGSLSSSLLAKRGHPFGRMGAAAGVIAACIAGAGLARFPLLAYALFLGAGVGIGVYNVNFAVLLQTSVPDEYLGRAAAGMQVVDQLIILLSIAAGGVLADAFGVRTVLETGAVLIGSTGLIAVAATRSNARGLRSPLRFSAAHPSPGRGGAVRS